MEKKKQFKTVDEYIANFPQDVQKILQKVRQTIKDTAPASEELISYQLPAFKLNGKPLVYFGGWKSHIGFYALPSGTAALKKELAKYKQAKGSIQFPLDQPIPYGLIKKIVKFRVNEVLKK